MDLGKVIKELRLSKSYNQKRFAEKIGITQSYLSQIENSNKNPSTELLKTISDKIGVSLPVLIWFGLDESDVSDDKKQVFNTLKPSVDSLISSLI